MPKYRGTYRYQEGVNYQDRPVYLGGDFRNADRIYRSDGATVIEWLEENEDGTQGDVRECIIVPDCNLIGVVHVELDKDD